ncbi:Pyridoxal phosphate-dependent transferase, major region, subdomain 2 [Penicillium expansum]|uniref:Pyridoxal phosphate-dependent transferase, major region, subdomain 2 n=1 Tax=Penicillium expansum TaxID=27334 RepID=A0A0A2JI32_PENEN|nr:Pyridoxal phosphate-dependent transferase, major region, subdomain 2 [Penicillium expansum]KGO54338.1 Pyridoxal phosphate-dependent transferase, major region, subdomain 2 [Penicillium expansum]
MTTDEFVARSHILHRAFSERPAKVVGGEGINLLLEDGMKVIDASCGPSVSCLGHTQPEIFDAITNHLKNDIAYVYSGSPYTNRATEKLADILLSQKPGGLSKAIFVNSGSHELRREFYKDFMSSNVSFVDPCYSYRMKLETESNEEFVQRLARHFEQEIIRVGPDRVAGFIAETVSGTTLGCLPAVPGYFRAIRDICDKYEILLILDEIICGMGKTGTMHAWEQEDIRGPDIQTIGKALGAGFVPLSGILLHQKIFDALSVGSGGLAHGHTFQAHPLACAAAVAVQKIIKRDNLIERVAEMGHKFEALLRQDIGPLPIVGDIRGRGLFWAIEFVLDKNAKSAFPPKDTFCGNVVKTALNMGLNILGNLGHTGEYQVDHVLVCPAYTTTDAELAIIVSLLKVAVLKASEPFFMGAT